MIKLTKFYKNKRILITGVTGFKGAWLACWLDKMGAKILGIAHNPNKNKDLFYKLKLQNKIKLKFIDVRNFHKINNSVKKFQPQIIFHLAAQPLIYQSYIEPYKTFDINFRGTLNLLETARINNVIKSLIIVTSDKCYESNNSTKGFKESDRLAGIDPYSASKASAEIVARAYTKSFFLKKNKKLAVSTARAGNVIGGGDWSEKRLIPDCIRSIMKKKVIKIRNPNFNRPWQHVLEPLKGYLILAKKQYLDPAKYSSSWNFGTKPNSITNVKTIVKTIVDHWGEGKFKLGKSKFYEQVNLQLNIKKSKQNLGWEPTYNIKKSIKITADWYKNVLVLKKKPDKITSDQIDKYMNDSKIL